MCNVYTCSLFCCYFCVFSAVYTKILILIKLEEFYAYTLLTFIQFLWSRLLDILQFVLCGYLCYSCVYVYVDVNLKY